MNVYVRIKSTEDLSQQSLSELEKIFKYEKNRYLNRNESQENFIELVDEFV